MPQNFSRAPPALRRRFLRTLAQYIFMQSDVHKLKTEKTGRVFTAGNRHDPQLIWIICHGYAQLASDFIGKFEILDNGRHLLVCPEGLHRFYTKGASGRVGASWMTKEERQDDIDDYVAWLDKVYEEWALPRSAARIVLFGFSQGGATVCRWLERTKHAADHLVLYGSTFPPDVVPSGNFARYIRGGIFYVLGSQDEYISAGEKEKQLQLIAASGKQVVQLDFEGKHEVQPQVLAALEEALLRS